MNSSDGSNILAMAIITGALTFALIKFTGADGVITCGLLGGLSAAFASWLTSD